MILIIDDDIAVRTSLHLLLENKGYKTVQAADPVEAVSIVQQHELSLIILDLNFSIETTGAEGMALLQGIKRLAPAVPVILITGWGTIDLAVQGMKLGA